MSKFLDIAQEYLRSDDWPFDRDDDKGIIRTGISGDGHNFRVFIDARDENDQLIVYVYGPTGVPEEKRQLAAEYVCRANYGLRIGNFELDMRDGEVRAVQAGNQSIALTCLGGEIGALDNACPHQGGPLGEGSIEEGLLRCRPVVAGDSGGSFVVVRRTWQVLR